MSEKPNGEAHSDTERIVALIQELRADMNKGFSSLHQRVGLVERNYHQAVETLPQMRSLNEKLAVVLNHMADGGERAKLLQKIGM